MNCSVAIQYLPMDASSDEETCRIVDEVILSLIHISEPTRH